MKPIAAPIVGGMITSAIHALILVSVFFVAMKARALRRGLLKLEAEKKRLFQRRMLEMYVFGRCPSTVFS
jgi:hypothetical protein